jgi:hypothetical protein
MKNILKTFVFLCIFGWVVAMFVMFVDTMFDESREVATKTQNV